jgi:hypothetical protein
MGAVTRTQYWNVTARTVRTGATGHGESLTDVEGYLIPMDRARGADLFSWGVADGLGVRSTPGATGVTVLPGTALDAAGRLILLMPGGTAVVDPTSTRPWSSTCPPWWCHPTVSRCPRQRPAATWCSP